MIVVRGKEGLAAWERCRGMYLGVGGKERVANDGDDILGLKL